MPFRSERCVLPALCLLILLPACKSSTPVEVDPAATPETLSTAAGFEPASNLSGIRLEAGRYPNLYAPDSYALWVDKGVAQAKLARDAQSGITANARLVNDANFISENYIVVECRLESIFPDASIAYDVVGLRNVDIYLTTSEGRHIQPMQRILGSHADETQIGALKRFARTNILIFAKEDILSGAPAVRSDAIAVRMVVDGFNSIFYFEWKGVPPGQGPQPGNAEAGTLGYSELYSSLSVLSRRF